MDSTQDPIWFFAHFWGDLSLSEQLSEIKPPLHVLMQIAGYPEITIGNHDRTLFTHYFERIIHFLDSA